MKGKVQPLAYRFWMSVPHASCFPSKFANPSRSRAETDDPISDLMGANKPVSTANSNPAPAVAKTEGKHNKREITRDIPQGMILASGEKKNVANDIQPPAGAEKRLSYLFES
jgi:hypothetical protein